jgi:hypothetical protein
VLPSPGRGEDAQIQPQLLHHVVLVDLLRPVVAALDVDVRPDRAQQFVRRRLLEDDEVVDALELGKDVQPVADGIDRPSLAFLGPHLLIGVDGDDEDIPQAPGLAQIRHVPGVNDVEAAVGEHDRPPGFPMDRDFDEELLERADLAVQRTALAENLPQDVGEGDRPGAEDLDLQPGRGVGEAHRLVPSEAIGPAGGEGGEDDVPRARHVIHAADHGGHQHGIAPLFLEQRPVLVQRQNHRLQIEVPPQLGGEAGIVNLRGVDGRVEPGGQLRLGPVGRDRRRPPVFAVVLDRRGVDDDGLALRQAELDQPTAHRLRADALVVILQADDVHFIQARLDARKQGIADRLVDRITRLDIDAEHLLGMAMLGESDDALLDRRRPGGILDQPVNIAFLRGDGIANRAALRVGAHHAEAQDASLEGPQAEGHVGRPARPILVVRVAQHGHRGIGAEPLRRPVEMPIEHEIAHHHRRERPVAGKFVQESGHGQKRRSDKGGDRRSGAG